MSANYPTIRRYGYAIVPLFRRNAGLGTWFARTAMRAPITGLRRGAVRAKTTTAGGSGSQNLGDQQKRGPFSGMTTGLLVVAGIGGGFAVGVLMNKGYFKERGIDFGVGGGRPDAIPITPEEISARLRENERKQTLAGLRVDTSTYAANFPSEDRNHELPFQMDNGGRGLAVGVYDGHGGSLCVERLFHELLPTVLGEVASEGAGTAIKGDKVLRMQDAIINAFVKLDNDMVLDRVKRAVNMSRPDAQAFRDFNTAIMGSCATVVVLDVDKREAFYGGTGDARTVIGTRNPETGAWEPVPLTTDHTYYNEVERQRMLEEHPGEQIFNKTSGRVLGGLIPTRAFGDAKYKWDDEMLKSIAQRFDTMKRPGGPENRTPPYVTAKPETGYRKMPPGDAFLIAATDGLWDELTNEQAVSLVGEWIDRRAGRQTVKTITAPKAETKAETETKVETETKAETVTQDEPKFTFVDDNAATHLVRNALGGANEEKLRFLMSLQPPTARRFRDDVTATVVFFEPPKA